MYGYKIFEYLKNHNMVNQNADMANFTSVKNIVCSEIQILFRRSPARKSLY